MPRRLLGEGLWAGSEGCVEKQKENVYKKRVPKQILSGFFFEFEKVQNRMKKGIDAVYKKRERQGSNLRMQSTLA